MKKFLFICLIFISACGLPKINYLYKSEIAFSGVDLMANSEVGVAVFGDAIPGLYEVIAADITLYTGNNLDFHSIAEDLSLSPDRMGIENVESIKEKYPQVRYVMVVWQDEPLTTRHHSKVKEEKEEPYYPYRKKEEEYELYSTYYIVKSEIMLFDLTHERLIAKSSQKFYQVAAYREKDVFASHTLLGTIEDILDAGEPGEEESKKFPVIEKVDAANAKGYFLRFLKEYK